MRFLGIEKLACLGWGLLLAAGPVQAVPPANGSPSVHSGARANSGLEGRQWLTPYLQRTENAAPPPMSSDDESELPADFACWWDRLMVESSRQDRQSIQVAVDALVRAALEHSPYIQAISVEPWIRNTYLIEENAAFDWRTYLEANFADKNDPIGNTLTTGTSDSRFKDQNLSGSAGLRRKTSSGADIDFSQKLGNQQNNSRFLLPNPQSTTRLELSFTQPLLNVEESNRAS
jgi:hypothetical protein